MTTTIPALPSELVTPDDADLLVMEDVSESETKKITFANLRAAIGYGALAAVRTVTTDAVLTAADGVVLVDRTAGPVVLTAPDPTLGYTPILIKVIDASTNAVSIAAHAAEQIEGAAGPHVLDSSDTADRRSWTLITDRTAHWVG